MNVRPSLFFCSRHPIVVLSMPVTHGAPYYARQLRQPPENVREHDYCQIVFMKATDKLRAICSKLGESPVLAALINGAQ